MIQNEKRKNKTNKASFFDLDGVIYCGSLGIDFMKYLHEKGVIAESFVLRIIKADQLLRSGMITGGKYLKICADLWRKSITGLETETIKSEAERFINIIKAKTSKNAIKLIESDKANGFMILGVTASPIEVASQISKALGFDQIIGTQVSTKDGRYTGKLIRPWPVGKGKAQIVQKLASKFYIDLELSKAYGDSELDIDMLKLVGEPIAVNPDNELEKYAKQHGWKIIRWQINNDH